MDPKLGPCWASTQPSFRNIDRNYASFSVGHAAHSVKRAILCAHLAQPCVLAVPSIDSSYCVLLLPFGPWSSLLLSILSPKSQWDALPPCIARFHKDSQVSQAEGHHLMICLVLCGSTSENWVKLSLPRPMLLLARRVILRLVLRQINIEIQHLWVFYLLNPWQAILGHMQGARTSSTSSSDTIFTSWLMTVYGVQTSLLNGAKQLNFARE